MAVAANISRKFYAVANGVVGFAGSRNYGVLNAAGTHAIGKKGEACAWSSMSTAKIVAECADEMAADGKHEWVPVFNSIEEARKG